VEVLFTAYSRCIYFSFQSRPSLVDIDPPSLGSFVRPTRGALRWGQWWRVVGIGGGLLWDKFGAAKLLDGNNHTEAQKFLLEKHVVNHSSPILVTGRWHRIGDGTRWIVILD
jgi:hypothetical protein